MKKILIVDDDIIIRITFEKLLETDNYIIKQAKDVNEAVNMMKRQIFDLLLLDLKLPSKGWESGFQILRKKRRLQLNADTPVIIVSGAPDDKYIKDRIESEDNVAFILLKPVDNNVLLEKVSQVIGSTTSNE
ncbi:response regulator [candidate division KSB1 bacterium]|nr:response regulator [candidate division KSB1 bacterium]